MSAFPAVFKAATGTYPVAGEALTKGIPEITELHIFVSSDQAAAFLSKPYDIFQDFNLTFSGTGGTNAVNKWRSGHGLENLYQWQLNIAVWCATSGCGVSVKDHLNHAQPFVASFFRFHVYYQVRRILHQLQCRLPGDDGFNQWNNRFSLKELIKLKAEFNLPQNPDFRYRGGDNQGLGEMHYGGRVFHGN